MESVVETKSSQNGGNLIPRSGKDRLWPTTLQ